MQLAADVQSNTDTEGRESIEDILDTIQARKRTIWGNQEVLMHVIFFFLRNLLWCKVFMLFFLKLRFRIE